MTESTNEVKPDEGTAPLRSVHTTSLPPLFDGLGISLLVTTYQAGKLVAVRADGGVINTHFRVFQRPMGLAARPERFSLGTQRSIEEFRNMPAVARKLEPIGRHDAAFLPRRIHVTGDIDIHEMDYAADGTLWFVNTRFSCLCTLNAEHSFVPRWRPPFVSAYSPTDRCHLNGLAMRDGRPRYVTALGTSDNDRGWRERKADGGVLMDIDDNRVLLDGLSMPHSPRWHEGKLWVLESGRGGIGWLDEAQGKLHEVATLPGFTRGLAFAGPYAFVGVSQVRESATFSGIPLTRTQSQRNCGVWVVDTRNGRIVGFLRFEDAVQEIFAVVVLPGIRYPDILNEDSTIIGQSYALPDAALREVAAPQAQEYALPHHHEAIRHFKEGNLELAEHAFRRALQIQPDYLPARFNLGVTLSDLCRFDEAVIELGRVIDDEAAHADAHRARGYAYSQLGNAAAATEHFRRAIAIRPDFAEAHLNLAMMLLMERNYAEGWEAFEWRWKTGQMAEFAPDAVPQWDGRPLPEGSVLVHTEQGKGDAIQYFRFLPEAAARCRRLIVVAPEELHPLLAGLADNIEARPAGRLERKDFDAYLAIMSLTRVFGILRDEDIPSQVPYLRVAPARAPLPEPREGLRVGLVWSGSVTFAHNARRSIGLSALAPLLEIPGIEWFSLQKGEPAGQLASLSTAARVHDIAKSLDDFGDTASVLSQLDLLITVDTTVAHLAGALGVETWLLLHATPDWRWQTDRSDSPWYPTMRLFRQPEHGDWPALVEAVAKSLRSRLTERADG